MFSPSLRRMVLCSAPVKTQRETTSRRPSAETNPSAVRIAMQKKVTRKITGRGQIAFPCVPALVDSYIAKLGTVFEVLGKPFTDEELTHLKKLVEGKLAEGWAASPFSLLVVDYDIKPPPHPGVAYNIWTRILTMDDRYNDWVATRTPPLFGKHPDAKVLDLAAQVGPAESAPVLDVGAGTGRNALPLARLGHPTYALEMVQSMADLMKKDAEAESLPLEVLVADVTAPGLVLPRNDFKLIFLAEVIASHFGDADAVRRAIANLTPALAPGGLLLFSTFLARDGYKPDTMARQISQVVWSCIFTRADYNFVHEEFPLDRAGEDTVYDYEKGRMAPEDWPPTGWFNEWSQGLDLFALPAGKAPMDLRWLTYRKR
jgi:2-polyprenyl-3-methyl-5-hydroxy-6-metoxy-1,4-benzoquinol methylase